MKPNFSGWATKAGLKCSDGRTIMPDAFKHQDGARVPLVWRHGHSDANNVLGYAVLENRPDGVYAHAYFNDTPQGKNAKILVEHGDITNLSIFANSLVERGKQVFHGMIRELSLVLSGANPGALIENVSVAHSDGDIEILEDEAVIYTGLTLEHTDDSSDDSSDETVHSGDKTAQDIYNAMTDEQKDVVDFLIGAAIESVTGEHSAESTDDDDSSESTDLTDTTDSKDELENNLAHKEGNTEMARRNVFEKDADGTDVSVKHSLSHDDVRGIIADATKLGSLKEAVESYALSHGIENIDILFPDAKAVSAAPEFDKRRTEWVAGVLNTTSHSPFSRIKTRSADLTHDEARARGFVKGNLKKEEFFGLKQRITTPTTVYKKQKLDRDDILDITDLDVVAWMKSEMRLMLDEEIARAVLIGDGRAADDEDKIRDPMGATEGSGIRSIVNDHELYVTTVYVNIDDLDSDPSEIIETVLLNRRFYKGTGTPKFYTTELYLTKMLLAKDKTGRRLYKSVDELATDLRVSEIIPVEVMEGSSDLVGIMVNLADFTLGADKGGDVSMFDDFDIDYNQYKYLIETRLSGALTKIKSALVVRKTAGTNVLVAPTAPSYNSATHTITIPVKTGVVYKVDGATVSGNVIITADTLVTAVPANGYYFENDAEDSWLFDYVFNAG